MRRHHVTTLALGAALALTALPARADDRAIAQQAFQEARALFAAGKVAEACPKFAAAAQLSPTPGVRLNLSDCYAKLGKSASAWSKADEALALAERAGDTAAAEEARTRKKALESKLSYVTIAVTAPRASGLALTLDGEKLPEAVWGTALPADPGEHVIAASAPGRKAWSSKATLAAEAARITVTVPVLEAEAASATATATAPAPADAATGSSGGLQRTIGLVTAAAGVVGLGVGTVFGLSAKSKKSDYEQHQGPDGRCVDAECAALSEDALGAARLSTIGFVAGGVLAAAGAVLWLTAPSNTGDGTSVALVPSAGAAGVGANVLGRF